MLVYILQGACDNFIELLACDEKVTDFYLHDALKNNLEIHVYTKREKELHQHKVPSPFPG